MAMQVILDVTSVEIRMPLLKTLMENTTIAAPTEDHARAMLSQLDQLIRWCRMSFKSKKYRNLLIVRGKAGQPCYW